MRYPSLRQGLVRAWCPLLGPSGYTLLDRSGYGDHGVLTSMDAGSDWVGTRYGWALDFDAVDDMVATNYTTAGEITYSCWFMAPNNRR
jgi:hypothetical protein